MLRTFSLWTLLVLSAAIFTTACSKDELAFGHDYLNQSDFVGAFIDSSATVSAITQLDNAMRYTRAPYIMYMVGQTSVPGFSTLSEASFLNRFYFDNLTVNFKDKGIELASITLELMPIPQFLGNTKSEQIIGARELTGNITRGIIKEYFETGVRSEELKTLISSTKILGTSKFEASPGDSTKIIQIPFTEERAKELFKGICSFYSQDSSVFYNDLQLNTIFKGLYVESLSEKESVIMNYKVRIVIKTKNNGEVQLLPYAGAYDQTIDSKGNDIPQKELDLYVQPLTVFKHTYTGEIQSQLNKPSQKTYVSGLMGLKTQLKFNNFDHWKDSAVVFNAANLYVPIKQFTKSSEVEVHNKTLQLNVHNSITKKSYSFTSSAVDSTMFNFNIAAFMTILRKNAEQASDYTFEIVMPDNIRYGNAFEIDVAKIKLVVRYSR